MKNTNIAKHVSTKKTSQLSPIPGKTGERQVKNSEGGYVFQVSDWDRLDRFLVLGSEGGTFYIREKTLTVQNADTIQKLLRTDGLEVVRRTVAISDEGRAHKNDYALFVLAMATSHMFAEENVRRAAFEALPKVARIGTHLFQFINFRKEFGGWGKSMKRAISKWYLDRPVDKMAHQMVKYQQREGWSHRDVLRLAHPYSENEMVKNVFDHAVRGYNVEKSYPHIIEGMNKAHNSKVSRPADFAFIISEYNLTREMVPTEWLTHAEVWEALFENMPMTAMIRNLGNMSKSGFLKPMSDASKEVVNRLGDEELLKKARIHPLGVLGALLTYSQGHGMLGKGSWEVTQPVVDALDKAFYKTFKFVEPTGKNHMLCLDVSGSMGSPVSNIPGMSCAMGAAAMSLVTANVEENYHVMAFDHGITPISISPRDRLDSVLKKASDINWGGTDCSLPMQHALKQKIDVDVFVVYTDSETYHGNQHPNQALQAYRNKMGRDAKLVVVGMNSNDFTIADPNDPGMLDVVGFDTATPSLISEFVR